MPSILGVSFYSLQKAPTTGKGNETQAYTLHQGPVSTLRWPGRGTKTPLGSIWAGEGLYYRQCEAFKIVPVWHPCPVPGQSICMHAQVGRRNVVEETEGVWGANGRGIKIDLKKNVSFSFCSFTISRDYLCIV